MLVSSCKVSSLYPALGAGAGGGAGSLGGPVVGGLGAVAGYSVGEVLKVQDQPSSSNFKPEQYQELLSLVAQASGENKSFIEKIEGGIYDILKLVGLVVGIMILVPIMYARLKCKKTLEALGLTNGDVGKIQSNSK